jgi:hypothetical protein
MLADRQAQLQQQMEQTRRRAATGGAVKLKPYFIQPVLD